MRVKKEINIWHFPTWYPHGSKMNLGIFVQKQILAASSFANQIVIYVYEDFSPNTSQKLSKNHHKNVVEIRVGIQPSKSKFVTLRRKFKAYQQAIEEALSQGLSPTIIHAHSISTASFVAKKTAQKHQVKWLLSEHWSGFLDASSGFKNMPYYKQKLWINHANQADKILVVSDVLKTAMITSGIVKPQYTIVPNVVEGIQPKTLKNQEEQIFEGGDKFIFLNVSDMVDNIKNISGIIRAFNDVYITNNDIELWLVGKGKDLQQLKSLANELPSKNAIQFYNELSHQAVLELYPKINATVINSHYETFSVVAAESLYAGKPIITTKCGGPEQFITDQQGILVAVDTPIELIGAMKKMIDTADNFNPLELNRYIANKFSPEVIANQLEAIYR